MPPLKAVLTGMFRGGIFGTGGVPENCARKALMFGDPETGEPSNVGNGESLGLPILRGLVGVDMVAEAEEAYSLGEIAILA
jgi:hypothetical protein